MTEFEIGLVGTGALLLMVFAGVRIYVVAAIVGVIGVVYIIGWNAGAGIGGTVRHSKSVNYALSVLPMFILIGFIAYHAGLTHALLGRRGPGVAGFLAVSLSLVFLLLLGLLPSLVLVPRLQQFLAVLLSRICLMRAMTED